MQLSNANASNTGAAVTVFLTVALAVGRRRNSTARKEIMSNSRLFSSLVLTWVAVPVLAMLLGAGPAHAQSSSTHYTFLVATGFLCDSADSSACPAVVKSANGDSFEISGVGTLTTPEKSVTAAGTFTHKSPNGVVLEAGVWNASELVSFDSYGVAPDALAGEGRAIGLPQFGSRRMGMFSGPTPAGGLAVLRIRLIPMLGLARNATLQVNCALGKVPTERATEGIRLAYEKGGAEFDEEISGRALFLLTRPGTSAAAKAPPPEPETNPAPTEAQQ
jgi:hypothetical protein